jgi:hypothetical protein
MLFATAANVKFSVKRSAHPCDVASCTQLPFRHFSEFHLLRVQHPISRVSARALRMLLISFVLPRKLVASLVRCFFTF